MSPETVDNNFNVDNYGIGVQKVQVQVVYDGAFVSPDRGCGLNMMFTTRHQSAVFNAGASIDASMPA